MGDKDFLLFKTLVKGWEIRTFYYLKRTHSLESSNFYQGTQRVLELSGFISNSQISILAS
jgi:hypothetical protein